MSDPIIKVSGLGKRYRIGVRHDTHRNLRDDIANIFKAPFQNFKRLRKLTNFDDASSSTDTPLSPRGMGGSEVIQAGTPLSPRSMGGSEVIQADTPLSPRSGERAGVRGRESTDIIWALKDVSFDINQGEVVGIIGRNGSGKSTLLKILSRITEPTEGYAEINGRVASLLEVGTGFHRDLTGRENIYLNGSILGMRKWEIDKKFDEIVAFSEIEKFIDTPVKHYSSGMYVRLAFAVAAHLDPEILLVDEVLAVGDASFQKKCLGKMNDLAKGGRTVLFVSHNMGAVKQLCTNGFLLEKGLLRNASNDISGLIKSYCFEDKIIESTNSMWKAKTEVTNDYFNVRSFSLCDKDGSVLNSSIVTNDEHHYLLIDFLITVVLRDLRFGIVIYCEDALPVLTSEYTDQIEKKSFSFTKGLNSIRVKIPAHFLNAGIYRVELTASSPSVGWILHPGKDISPKITFEIKGGLSNSPCWTSKRAGLMAPILEWENV